MEKIEAFNLYSKRLLLYGLPHSLSILRYLLIKHTDTVLSSSNVPLELLLYLPPHSFQSQAAGK